MKVLQLGKFYPIRGGVEKVMYDLMLGISAREIRCDMLSATTEGHPGGNLFMNEYANLIAMPTQFKAAATMIAPGMLLELRKIAADYDIIHIHHPDPMAALALYFSGYKGKVVLHWHSDILKQKLMLKLYSGLQSWLIRRADLIVGTSPVYVQQSSFLAEVQHKTDFIPIGVEPMLPDAGRTAALRQRYKDKKLVFSLGRLVPYKGYQYLIAAAQQLDSSYKIIIGGKGPLQEQLQTLIQESGVQDRVELIGFVADEELPAWYNACDVFCLSSVQKTEAFAIVQIEAMCCAKPVVSTAIPGSGVSWVNADGVSGLIVEPEDAAALAAALQQLCANPANYERLSAGSHSRYQKLFTRDKMVDKCLDLYTKLLEK